MMLRERTGFCYVPETWFLVYVLVLIIYVPSLCLRNQAHHLPSSLEGFGAVTSYWPPASLTQLVKAGT